MVHTAHALQAVQVRLNSVSNEVTFSLEAKELFAHISPKIALVLLSNETWYSLRMRYKQGS
jgi:hypothetical protein